MIDWNFPSNNNGQKTALNDAGIETFKGDPVKSLAREVIQNSIDAHKPGAAPVEIHFTLKNLPTSSFPGRDRFEEILDACKAYWQQPAPQQFFAKALEEIKRKAIPMLIISDYNTTGLTGAADPDNSNWENLIKSTGASDKPSTAGGSFGIGKNAPFACTPLRTVFYGTLDETKQIAFQGVAKLVTHKNKQGDTTQGTGFYGLNNKNNPILDIAEIPEIFDRTRVGTDLFIFGFDHAETWKQRIICSVIENFFVALHHEELKIVVDDILITKTALPELIKEYFAGSNSNLPRFYDAYVSEDSEFKVDEDFQGLGRVELHILKGKNFPKRVAMTRKTGMLIFERGHFQTPMKFAGVLHAKGEEINALLRSLEPPAHDKWEASRSDDPAEAQRVLNALYKWVRDCVKEISNEGVEQEYDFDGMQQYLPDDQDDNPKQVDTDDEDKTIPKEVDIVFRQPKQAQPSADKSPSKETAVDIDSDLDDAQLFDDPDNENDDPNPAPNSNRQPHQPIAPGSGDEKNGAQAGGENAPMYTKAVALKKRRAFCADPKQGIYKIIVQTNSTTQGMLQLGIVGEVEKHIAHISNAKIGDVDLPVNNKGQIGPIDLDMSRPVEIIARLSNITHCALEVSVYEN